jgi:hypothetical protein
MLVTRLPHTTSCDAPAPRTLAGAPLRFTLDHLDITQVNTAFLARLARFNR